MADAILVATAKAVALALNESTAFQQKFTAERSYADFDLPLTDADPSDRVLVDVVPVGMNYGCELTTQTTIDYSPAIDIVVRKRLGPERRQADGRFSPEEIDELVLFVEQINEFFGPNRMQSFDAAAWDAETGTKILAAYMPSHLRQHHQFTGRVRVPFVAQKEVV